MRDLQHWRLEPDFGQVAGIDTAVIFDDMPRVNGSVLPGNSVAHWPNLEVICTAQPCHSENCNQRRLGVQKLAFHRIAVRKP